MRIRDAQVAIEPASWRLPTVSWEAAPGIVVLPDGARVRGRRPPATPWAAVWVHWPDFWLPLDRQAASDAFARITFNGSQTID